MCAAQRRLTDLEVSTSSALSPNGAVAYQPGATPRDQQKKIITRAEGPPHIPLQ